jgi:hypothetical protein
MTFAFRSGIWWAEAQPTCYAMRHSRYALKPEMDRRYPALPKRNVENTGLGYRLYEEGAFP